MKTQYRVHDIEARTKAGEGQERRVLDHRATVDFGVTLKDASTGNES